MLIKYRMIRRLKNFLNAFKKYGIERKIPEDTKIFDKEDLDEIMELENIEDEK